MRCASRSSARALSPLSAWLHDSPATLRRSAMALVKFRVIRRSGSLILIVVGELHARLDILFRVDPDLPPVDHRFAVRIAGVVDVARVVPLTVAVDHRLLVECEEESVMPPHRLVVVPPIGLGVRDALPGVFDDSLAGPDSFFCEDTAPLNRRAANLVEAVFFSLPSCHRRAATGELQGESLRDNHRTRFCAGRSPSVPALS